MERKPAPKSPILFLFVGVLVVLAVGGWFLLKKGNESSSVSDPATFLPQEEKEVALPEGWKTYHSEELDYSLNIPVDWPLEEKTTEDGRIINVAHPGKLAFINIIGHQEPSLNESGFPEALKEREEGLKQNPRLTIKNFASGVEGEFAGYLATGEEIINEQVWQFEERGLFGPTGKIILMHASVLPSAASENGPKLIQIMDSMVID